MWSNTTLASTRCSVCFVLFAVIVSFFSCAPSRQALFICSIHFSPDCLDACYHTYYHFVVFVLLLFCLLWHWTCPFSEPKCLQLILKTQKFAEWLSQTHQSTHNSPLNCDLAVVMSITCRQNWGLSSEVRCELIGVRDTHFTNRSVTSATPSSVHITYGVIPQCSICDVAQGMEWQKCEEQRSGCSVCCLGTCIM